MGLASTVINHPDEYWAIVDQHPLVFVLFVSEYCEACQGANIRFERVSEHYNSTVKSVILDTRQTPKIEALGDIGTPTLVVYKEGKEATKLKGIGYPEDQEKYLEGVFNHFLNAEPFPELPEYVSL